ncbi:hypothetical protein EMCRGX_G024488 [Ephydatia muelleri]
MEILKGKPTPVFRLQLPIGVEGLQQLYQSSLLIRCISLKLMYEHTAFVPVWFSQIVVSLFTSSPLLPPLSLLVTSSHLSPSCPFLIHFLLRLFNLSTCISSLKSHFFRSLPSQSPPSITTSPSSPPLFSLTSLPTHTHLL